MKDYDNLIFLCFLTEDRSTFFWAGWSKLGGTILKVGLFSVSELGNSGRVPRLYCGRSWPGKPLKLGWMFWVFGCEALWARWLARLICDRSWVWVKFDWRIVLDA